MIPKLIPKVIPTWARVQVSGIKWVKYQWGGGGLKKTLQNSERLAGKVVFQRSTFSDSLFLSLSTTFPAMRFLKKRKKFFSPVQKPQTFFHVEAFLKRRIHFQNRIPI